MKQYRKRQVDKAGHVHAADVSCRNHKMMIVLATAGASAPGAMELYMDQDLPILQRWVVVVIPLGKGAEP